MIRTIIVDDERIVRLALKSCIDWHANGFELCGVFDRAEQAVDYINKQQPQLVITDIKMGAQSGLDLIKIVKNLYPNIKIIVLSNYDDFNYVSESYKEGISEYILKQQMEPKNFLESLLKVKKKIEQNNAVLYSNTHKRNREDDTQKRCLKKMVYLFVTEEIEEYDIEEFSKKLDEVKMLDNYFCIAIDFTENIRDK